MADISIKQFIIDSLHEGVVICDKNGKFLYFNKAAEEILGLGLMDRAPDEWAKTYGAFLPDKVTPFPTDQYPLVRGIKGEDTRDVVQFVKNPNKPDGIFISINGSPIKDEKGEIKGAVVIFNDITSRKQQEASLKESLDVEEKLNEVFLQRETRMQELKDENDRLKKEIEALKAK